MNAVRPSKTAALVWQDARVKVYADGTWVSKIGGVWSFPVDVRFYAAQLGYAAGFTSWGHCKATKAIAPDGTTYDFLRLAGLS